MIALELNCDLTMGPRKVTSDSKIGEIVGLAKRGSSNKEIAELTGVPLRTVQRWTKRFKDGGMRETPKPGTSTGRKPKLNYRAVRFLRMVLERNPRITSRRIKQEHPKVFGGGVYLHHKEVHTLPPQESMPYVKKKASLD